MPELARIIFDNITTKVKIFQNLVNNYVSFFISKF